MRRDVLDNPTLHGGGGSNVSPDWILPRYAFWLSADIWPDILELIFKGGDDWLLDEEYAAG